MNWRLDTAAGPAGGADGLYRLVAYIKYLMTTCPFFAHLSFHFLSSLLHDLSRHMIHILGDWKMDGMAQGLCELGTLFPPNRLKRAITVETMEEKLKMVAANSNIQVVGYAFLGIQTETEDEMEATVKFLLDMPLARIGLGWCNALPGTEIFNNLVKDGIVDLDTFDFSLLDVYMDCPVDITSVGISRVKEKIAEANRRFYFRPKILWQILTNIRTFEQFMNAAKTGVRRLTRRESKDAYTSEGWYDIYSSSNVGSG